MKTGINTFLSVSFFAKMTRLLLKRLLVHLCNLKLISIFPAAVIYINTGILIFRYEWNNYY